MGGVPGVPWHCQLLVGALLTARSTARKCARCCGLAAPHYNKPNKKKCTLGCQSIQNIWVPTL